MKKKKRLKPQHYLMLGALAVIIFMMIIARIPGGPSEPIALPMDWFEAIKPENLVDLGVVPQEKQVFELEANKVAQITVEPGQSISVMPIKGTLRVAHFTMSGELQIDGLLDPQKTHTFSLLPATEERLIFMMGEFMGPVEFEVGPTNLLLAP